MSVTVKRGFAAMDPGQRSKLARMGGIMAHKLGVAHRFSSTEAREAGRKGGVLISQDREHMSKIGKRGGRRSHRVETVPAESDIATPVAS